MNAATAIVYPSGSSNLPVAMALKHYELDRTTKEKAVLNERVASASVESVLNVLE